MLVTLVTCNWDRGKRADEYVLNRDYAISEIKDEMGKTCSTSGKMINAYKMPGLRLSRY